MLAIAILQFPIYRLYIPITIASWALLTLVIGLYKRHKYQLNLRLLLLVALYGLYALGVLWSSNKEAAQFDIEVKMSLAIIPVFYMFTNYSKKQVKFLIYSFFVGLMIAIVYLFIKAYSNYYCTCNFQYFFYIQLTKDIHPSYLAFYYNVAIGVLLIDYMTCSFKMFKKKVIYLILICVFACFSGILLSKIGFITTLLLVLVLYIFWFIKKKWKLLLFFVMVTVTAPVILYMKSNLVQHRVHDLISGISSDETEAWMESTSIRKTVWGVSTDILKKNLILGVGTGDVQEELAMEYYRRDLYQISGLNLNAHNQFLQTTLALGIGGGILFLIVFLQPLISLKELGYYNLVFSVICLLFFLTESVLETQAGVVFIAVFYTIFNHFNIVFKNETSNSDPVLST